MSAAGGLSNENQQPSGVLTGDQFQDILRDAKIGFSEHDLDLLTTFAIKGSRRLHAADSAATAMQPVNTRIDLIQFFNFEKALLPIIKHMRKESDDQKRKAEQMD